EILPEPPEARAANNPWPLWPKVKKTDYGQKEAMACFGADPREYLTTVKEIVGDGKKVTGIRTVRVEWKSEGGRMIPVEIPGSEQERPADIVLTAMGFTGPEDTLIGQLSLKTDARGMVLGRDGGYRTSTPTVFAAGDMRRGPSLVVWAIYEGRRAARECHAWLRER
ncbi:MAG: FAD-dependent oxidoreductase, partial [Clostridiales Family XIII bacterium]|nr:FAD-dependent oxidoreductase [Clostridiales Family XIII bacterium]